VKNIFVMLLKYYGKYIKIVKHGNIVLTSLNIIINNYLLFIHTLIICLASDGNMSFGLYL
jgi:hypothetical protein